MRCAAALAVVLALATLPLPAQEDEEQVRRTVAGFDLEVGATREVAVGEVAIRELGGEEYAWAELLSDVRVSQYGALLPKGHRLWLRQRSQGAEACTRLESTRVCLIDDEGDGRFDKSRLVGGGRATAVMVRYEVRWAPGEGGAGGWELLYLGSGGGVYRFELREAGCGGRSSREVTYDRSGEATPARFRAADLRLTAIGAGAVRVERER